MVRILLLPSVDSQGLAEILGGVRKASKVLIIYIDILIAEAETMAQFSQGHGPYRPAKA